MESHQKNGNLLGNINLKMHKHIQQSFSSQYSIRARSGHQDRRLNNSQTEFIQLNSEHGNEQPFSKSDGSPICIHSPYCPLYIVNHPCDSSFYVNCESYKYYERARKRLEMVNA